MLTVPLLITIQAVSQDGPRDFGLISPKAAVTFSSGAEIANALALTFRDSIFGKEITTELQELSSDIEKSLVNAEDEYLVKVQVYTDEKGTQVVPGGQLLVPIGPGREPVLALAKVWSHPQIVASPPEGLQNASYYLWVKRSVNNKLEARTIPIEFVPALEKQAHDEARRMVLSPHSHDVQKMTVNRAAYWNDVASLELAKIESNARRSKLENLTRQFANAQDEFNEAYEGYQRISRGIAEEQNQAAILNRIMGLTKIVEG